MVTPSCIGYRVACFLADCKFLFSRTERREIVGNFRLIFPHKSIRTLRGYARQIFRNFSKYLFDFLRFQRVNREYINRHIEVVNLEYIDEALKNGKGAIILSAHMGSWEFGGVTMSTLGYPMNVVVLEHKNKYVNRFFIKQRERLKEKVIPISIALKRCFSALKNNELLAIVGDRDFTNNGVLARFFGRNTLLPKGPAAFSLKTGAPIIPGFVIRFSDNTCKLIFEKPVEYSPTGDFDKDLLGLIEKYTKVLESYIKKYPTQWYCFRRIWI